MGTISTTKLAGLSIIFGPIICLAAYFYQQLVIFADVEWAVAASWASLAAENSTAVAITSIIIPIGIFMLVHGLQFVANEIRANGNGAALAAYSVPLIMFGWIGISLSCGIYIAGANFPEPATQAAAAFLAATGILNIVGVLQSLGFLFIFFNTFTNKLVFGEEAYFDLSDNEIQIQTDFNGKEVIIFGLTDPELDTILTIKGPNKDTKVSKKERLFGFWFNTKKIIYRDLPSIFFIASSSPIKKILNDDTIIKKSLYFEKMFVNLLAQRNFNFTDQNTFEIWNENMIKIKKELNLYKEYKLKIIDDKLFQTRVFFPTNTVPGFYDVNIYQIKNKIIISEKNKKIIVKKAGIGNKIFQFAHNKPATYGILCIVFAVLAGLMGATIFRRL